MKFSPEELQHVPIVRAAAEGQCVAKTDKGVIFVKYAAPGDVADIRIYKKEKKSLFASIVKLHEKSSHRTEPACEHFGLCGGCKWQHVAYHHQLEYKAQQVIDNFERLGKFDFPKPQEILGCEEIFNYRNKMEFGFSSERFLSETELSENPELKEPGLGFHIPGRFDKILDLNFCHLQKEPSNSIRLACKKIANDLEIPFYNLKTHEGILRQLMIRTTETGDLMVLLSVAAVTNDVESLLHQLKTQFPEITSLLYVVNTKLNETIYDLEVSVFDGKPSIREQLGSLTFTIRPKSFFQTNTKQALRLYQTVKEFAAIEPQQLVYDLYTGTGSIALFVADNAKRVVGVESVAQAIDDAKENAAINGIGNTRFFVGDMKDMLTDAFIAENGMPDVIITDPPRAGMHEKVTEKLLELRAKTIVYVSCNPATQARDLSILCQVYKVTQVQAVDMFPHTHHVENVVKLELR
jgi:23S rRNA (uracil1939-C5)-methyltransferase